MIVVLEFSYIATTYVLDDPSFAKYIQSAFWAKRSAVRVSNAFQTFLYVAETFVLAVPGNSGLTYTMVSTPLFIFPAECVKQN